MRDVHEVNNNSKGCGGIMRVAPVALFLSAENDRAVKHGGEAHFTLEAIEREHCCKLNWFEISDKRIYFFY